MRAKISTKSIEKTKIKKKKIMLLYTPASLEEAVKKVKNGEMSYRQAVEAYDVPKSTIADHVKSNIKSRKLGRPAVLTDEIELLLVHAINKLADWGFGVSDQELKVIIRNYLISTNQMVFSNNLPGRKFFILFKQRHHKILSSRIAQNLAVNRAVALNNDSLDQFFQICQKYYDYLEIHNKPQYVYNVDETGLSGNQGCTKILCKKGTNILILIALK